VVASEFKSLSEFTATSTVEINNSLEDLTHEIAALVKNATLSVSVANELGTDAQGIEEQIHNVPEILSIVTQNQNAISLENKEISVAVETISQEVAVLSGGISESVELIKEAAFSLDDLRSISEQMTGTSVKLGVATDDTLFINHVKKIARAIGSTFEDGVKKGIWIAKIYLIRRIQKFTEQIPYSMKPAIPRSWTRSYQRSKSLF